MLPTVSPKQKGRRTLSVAGRLLAAITLLALSTALIPPVAAQNLPNWYNPTTKKGFAPNLPDFYQHQFWEQLPNGTRAGWEKEGGYCRMVSVIDALYYWKVYSEAPFGPPNNAPYRGLYNNAITQPNTWLNTSGDAIASYVARKDGDINSYLESLGYGDTAAKNGKPALLVTPYSRWRRVRSMPNPQIQILVWKSSKQRKVARTTTPLISLPTKC